MKDLQCMLMYLNMKGIPHHGCTVAAFAGQRVVVIAAGYLITDDMRSFIKNENFTLVINK